MNKHLRRIAFVLLFGLFATPVFALAPNDPYYSYQWYLPHIQAEEAWDLTTGSRRVIVAVIDVGVDINHEDLKENIWINEGEVADNGVDDDQNGYIDDVHGWNFLNGTGDVRISYDNFIDDRVSHGTIVASVIGAVGNNNKGIAGIAWNVQIMPVVALNEEGTGAVQDVERAVRYAVDNGADIINISVQGQNEQYPLAEDAFEYAYRKGVLTIVSAGNSGVSLDDEPDYPACSSKHLLTGVLTVGALNIHDGLADYSNYGSCVNILAPGANIIGAVPTDSLLESSEYRVGFEGTSFAAPVVSGLAALIKSRYPSWTASHIREQLLQTARSSRASIDPGIGVVDLYQALALDTSTALLESFDLYATLPGFETRVRVQGDEVLRFIIPFTMDDKRGATAAVADIDQDGIPEIGIVPASGTVAEAVFYRPDGTLLKKIYLPGVFTDGAVIAGANDGFVIADALGGNAWAINEAYEIRSFYPYEMHYKEGVDVLSIAGAVAFAPTYGGGRLVISSAEGAQLVSAFPFGTEVEGRWSLAKMTDEEGEWLVFSGSVGSKRIRTSAIGQVGWESVAIDQLSSSSAKLTLSSGRMVDKREYLYFDRWEASSSE